MNKENEPPDDDVLWRCMSFAKFVDLLDGQALFFTRAIKFKDTREGTLRKANEGVRRALQGPYEHGQLYVIPGKGESKEEAEQRLGYLLQRDMCAELQEWRPRVLVSCWSENRPENYDVWEAYASKDKGVAIMTTHKSLAKSLECSSKIHIVRVIYGDEGTVISEDSLYTIYSHKLRTFEWEREVRAITIPPKVKEYEPGARYKVNLSSLIKKVLVAPCAKDEFVECVRSVVRCYDLNVDVRKSQL